MKRMKMRDAEAKDAKQLDMLLAKLIREESQYDSNLSSNCEIENNYSDRIGLDGHKLIVIEDAGEIVGYLYGFLYHIPGVYKSPIAILDALFVKEKHRRKGYASMLIAEFRAFAAKCGAAQIELKVLSNNLRAVALYEKLSFAETKKYMKMVL